MPPLVSPVLAAGRLACWDQPRLEADDLLLRPWAAQDVDAVVAAYGDPAIQYWHLRSMTADEAEAWIASWPRRWVQETGASWAVTRAGAVVGHVSARGFRLGEGSAEMSYWVTPQARGHAVAPRSLTAVTAWLFHTVGLHRAEWEGTKRQQLMHADGWHDMHSHAQVRR